MKNRPNQHGFTYILAMTMVMIMGIMLGMTGQLWKTIMQREREEELIFRGSQVAGALYQRMACMQANFNPNAPPNVLNQSLPAMTPDVLETLVNPDTRCFDGKQRKFLRRSATIDPMTSDKWKLLPSPTDPGRVAGVASNSTKEPFKKGGFPDELAPLAEQSQYSDWKFTWDLKKPR